MKYLYTTGIMDQCIIQWKITQEWKLWDLDLLPHDRNTKDLYSEVMTKNKFDNLYDNILPLREEIYDDVIANIEETKEYTYDLTLKSVIGRRAFTRRNNLFYDYGGRIIYVASTQVVQLPVDKPLEREIVDEEEETKQEVLQSEDSEDEDVRYRVN